MKRSAVVKSMVSALGALAGLAVLAFPQQAMADIKIGLSGPFSGPMAADGQEYIDGFGLALEQLGNQLGGQKVQVLQGDDQMKPDVGSQVMRKFIELDKVDAIVGLGYSNIIMANLRRLKESGVVSIAVAGGPSPMAGAECGANVFSIAYPNDGSGEAIGKLVQDKGYKNVYLMAPNYQAGKDMLAGFKRWYKGGVAAEVYTQINQTDYSAEITQLQLSKMDAVFMFYPGSMGVNFTKQLKQAGVIGKVPVYSTFTVDGTNLPALREAAVGVISGNTWNPALENPENQKFVKAFEARYKRVPSTYAANAYDAAFLLDTAVRKLKGDTSNKVAFAAAVKAAGAEFKSVRGPFRFNTNNMPIQNYYAFEIVKEGDQIKGKLVATPLVDHKDAYVAACPLK
ncbi:extracellular ligand-binding receptor [Herbaspirillum sp. BH-1]|uniref:Branched-chain amino acid transport system substrate-binding protein n=1 Tax=Herbaspirillum frisingense TaxID=92645 RepID=A0ABU1PG46_9BURK|nr:MULTISPECIES: ABC transporter substrate-binding protein [Herbaspirillum]MDR6584904.1 branched-chain amino acid transport system substrate-binding protein [Herbaspirillum frisingense]PLY60760.1 extracellular ligand-binding receptor [Herbaspirillum sp. BH-1]